jgi:hypothetical protein
MHLVHSFPLTTIALLHASGLMAAETHGKCSGPLLLLRIFRKLSLPLTGSYVQTK